MEKLRLKAAEEEYKRMTKNVSPGAVSILREYRSLSPHTCVIISLFLCILIDCIKHLKENSFSVTSVSQKYNHLFFRIIRRTQLAKNVSIITSWILLSCFLPIRFTFPSIVFFQSCSSILVKKMDSQVMGMINFLFTVIGAFVFAYKAVEYSLPAPNLSLVC